MLTAKITKAPKAILREEFIAKIYILERPKESDKEK